MKLGSREARKLIKELAQYRKVVSYAYHCTLSDGVILFGNNDSIWYTRLLRYIEIGTPHLNACQKLR